MNPDVHKALRDSSPPSPFELSFEFDGATAAPNGWNKELLQSFRGGERDALEQVYRQFSGDIALLLRRGFAFESRGRKRHFVGYRSAHDLHDALHETFRRAFEPSARQAYDGIRPYAPYLRTIARNLVLAEFRRREALFVDVADGVVESAGPLHVEVAPTPEQAVASKQVQQLMQSFLGQLDPKQRELLQLRFVDGLSQRDAAERLSLGRQRLRSAENKLRKKLVRYLKSRGEEELLPKASLLWAAFVGSQLHDTFAAQLPLRTRSQEAWA